MTSNCPRFIEIMGEIMVFASEKQCPENAEGEATDLEPRSQWKLATTTSHQLALEVRGMRGRKQNKHGVSKYK